MSDFIPRGAIREMHVWIGHFAGGGEGMLTATLPIPGGGGVQHMPLLGPTRTFALQMEPMAKQVQATSKGQLLRLELRTFHALIGMH